MVRVVFVQADGMRIETNAQIGETVMEVAFANRISGIDAECGGGCACATCHVYVDEAWAEKVGSPSELEEDMLDFAYDVRPTSRLSCQIKVREEWDGLVLHVPASE